MVEPYLNQVGGKVDNDVSLFTGGIDTYTDKAFLEANVMPYAMNMTMSKPPQIRTRNGRTTLATFMNNQVWASNIGEIIDLIPYSEYLFFAITEVSGGTRKIVKIYRGYDTVANNYNNNFETATMMTIARKKEYYYTTARQATSDYIYISADGVKVKIAIPLDATEKVRLPSAVTATSVSDGHYGIVCFHKGRLFIGEPGSNIITFSALNDFDNFDNEEVYQLTTETPTTQAGLDTSIKYIKETDDVTYTVYKYNGSSWVTDGTIPVGSIAIDTTTGRSLPDYSIIAGDFNVTNAEGRLVALKSFDDKLMIFCEHSMHCVYGDTPDVSMQNQFQLVDLNNNLGAKAEKCIAIGGGKLFWLGDNNEVYEYTGSAINIISRPGKTRNSTLALGGISGLINPRDVHEGPYIFAENSMSKFTATADKLYINTWNARRGVAIQKLLFVFDVYNRAWWCEDGAFSTIGDFKDNTDQILLGLNNGDILISNIGNLGYDETYNFETNKIAAKNIKYEFHTRVYGADGVDMRKTLNDVWFQARADAEVLLDDTWNWLDDWVDPLSLPYNPIKIGDLTYTRENPMQATLYRPDTYAQQVCYVEKMYGQRLNTFQIVVKGEGLSQFYLMKREWRAR